jgi:hypothetical protein
MRFSCSWCLEFIGGLNVEETRERRSSHPRNCVVHLVENGVKKFFSRSPEPFLVTPCEEEEEEEEEEEDSSSGEVESKQSVAPLKPGRSPTSS